MSIQSAMYEHTEIWVWSLVAIVVALAVSCWMLWASRVKADASLSYTRAELRRLRGEWARSRKPAQTLVLPALPLNDPEEFKRTQIRSVR